MNQKKATNAGSGWKAARGSLTISASLILDEVSRRFKGGRGRRPQITAATPPHSVLPSGPPIEHLPPFTERSSSDRHHQPTEQCPGRMHLTCERSLARLTDHVPLVLLGVGVKRASERASERTRAMCFMRHAQAAAGGMIVRGGLLGGRERAERGCAKKAATTAPAAAGAVMPLEQAVGRVFRTRLVSWTFRCRCVLLRLH